MAEQIEEKGIVIEAKDGRAKVELLASDACEECTAKIICKPRDENAKMLEVSDPFGVKPGDQVTINVEGSEVFKASLKLYGIPLFLLIAGILAGSALFTNDWLIFLAGVIPTTLYYIGLYFFWKRNDTQVMPKIVFVKKS